MRTEEVSEVERLRVRLEKTERKLHRRQKLCEELAGALRLYLGTIAWADGATPDDEQQAYEATQVALTHYDESKPA